MCTKEDKGLSVFKKLESPVDKDIKDSIHFVANCLNQQSKIAKIFAESLEYKTIRDIENFAKEISEKLEELSNKLY
jgi:hypothetical protein